ncbi:NDP-hexose 2,3-dehydratase family protein [Myxococcota bacterium]|nr:NDP-hexose 2,3-dehydratase family protein [Myxococcota bacterium]
MNVAGWIDERRKTLWPDVHSLPWSANAEWEFREGGLRHVTDAFFSIVGVRVARASVPGVSIEFPIIDQPEIGLLGFVVCPSADGPRWLLQAKSEPGSVDYVQVGPTVQATESNYKRRHGGSPTRYFDLFHDARNPALVDVPQSEQGSRFLGKFNRNAIRLVSESFDSAHPSWRWFDSDAVKQALRTDFLINTDSRSVMVCSPWRLLCGEEGPFGGSEVGIGDVGGRSESSDLVAALRHSYSSSSSPARTKQILAGLRAEEAGNDLDVRRTPLEALAGWEIDDRRIFSREEFHDVEVENYAVRAPGREVERWQQPLLKVTRQHVAGLVLQRRGGRLETFLRFAREPGFGRSVELGPSYQSDGTNPRWVEELALEQALPRILSVRQSDEGGRFMQSIIDYAIHVVDASPALPSEGGVWVDLAELEALCRISGVVTNEGRSAVSVLLALA